MLFLSSLLPVDEARAKPLFFIPTKTVLFTATLILPIRLLFSSFPTILLYARLRKASTDAVIPGLVARLAAQLAAKLPSVFINPDKDKNGVSYK